MKTLTERFPVYSRLLRLYPSIYRERYGEQALQTLADMLDDSTSGVARGIIWLRTVVDFPLSVTRQRFYYIEHAFTHETPGFVKRNTAISIALFVPFFVLAIFNDATAHGLYRTWVWRLDVFITWIVVLPAAGLLLSILTLVLWLSRSRREKHQGWVQSLRDLQHNWPMVASALIGLGILGAVFFHDSVHCITGNPLVEAHNWHATWRCVQQS